MSAPEKFNRESRAAEKAAARKRDLKRLKAGEDPAVLQRENSIFPPDFFKNGKFSNLKEAVGQ